MFLLSLSQMMAKAVFVLISGAIGEGRVGLADADGVLVAFLAGEAFLFPFQTKHTTHYTSRQGVTTHFSIGRPPQ